MEQITSETVEPVVEKSDNSELPKIFINPAREKMMKEEEKRQEKPLKLDGKAEVKLKYKEEKRLKTEKRLRKTMEYKDSYKDKEQFIKNSARSEAHHSYDGARSSYQGSGTYQDRGHQSRERRNYDDGREHRSVYIAPKPVNTDLCDDIIMILKEKIDTKKIELTKFEEKTINKFFAEFQIKPRQQVNTTIASVQTPLHKLSCNTGKDCITWYCKFEHPETRKEECKCEDKTCDKLHSHQALCKNPKHSDNCSIAHRVEDIAN